MNPDDGARPGATTVAYTFLDFGAGGAQRRFDPVPFTTRLDFFGVSGR